MKPCKCGPTWLAVNSCACRGTPKGVTQRRTVTAGAQQAKRLLGEGDHRGELQQTKITHPTRHFVIEDGRVRKVAGWHRES